MLSRRYLVGPAAKNIKPRTSIPTELLAYLFDVGSDMWNGVELATAEEDEPLWAASTLALILTPNIIACIAYLLVGEAKNAIRMLFGLQLYTLYA